MGFLANFIFRWFSRILAAWIFLSPCQAQEKPHVGLSCPGFLFFLRGNGGLCLLRGKPHLFRGEGHLLLHRLRPREISDGDPFVAQVVYMPQQMVTYLSGEIPFILALWTMVRRTHIDFAPSTDAENMEEVLFMTALRALHSLALFVSGT